MAKSVDSLTDLIKAAPVATLVVEDGVVRGVSNEAVQVLGVPRDRLLGVDLVEFMVPELAGSVGDALQAAGSSLNTVESRLGVNLAPIEFTFRQLSRRTVAVGVRSLAREHGLSANAGGELTHDLVTRLPNRYHVLEQLHHRLGAPRPMPLAVVAVWIDELGTMREERGGRVADRICRQVGERMAARLRGPDLLGRFDESGFVALLTTDAEGEGLVEIASRLRDEVAFPVEIDGGLVSFTATVAVGQLPPRSSLQSIVMQLDSAGERAARSGGNRTIHVEI